jgi:uncharacterized protein (AIM24 family)
MDQKLSDFVNAHEQQDRGQDRWELENERILEVKLMQNGLWTKAGSMIAYRGDVKFRREGMLEHGTGRFLKEFFTGEGAALMRAEGRGRVYLADKAKRITVLKLEKEHLFVNGSDLLAFEDGLKWDIRMMRKVAGVLAGGLFNLRLDGSGRVAICTHGRPMALRVTRETGTVFTDPQATVAWSGALQTDFKTALTLGSFFGRGSREGLQMAFRGEGFVLVQPYEEEFAQIKR